MKRRVSEGGYRMKNFTQTTITTGMSFGSCLAIVVSYVAWRSIPLAILHGLLGWFYVAYYVIVHN